MIWVRGIKILDGPLSQIFSDGDWLFAYFEDRFLDDLANAIMIISEDLAKKEIYGNIPPNKNG